MNKDESVDNLESNEESNQRPYELMNHRYNIDPRTSDSLTSEAFSKYFYPSFYERLQRMDIKRSIVNELHKPIRKHFKRRRVIVKGFDDIFQADLVDVQKFSRENYGNKYILTILDLFTKRAWAVPIRPKGSKDVAAAMESVLKNLKKTPKNLQTDDGLEFMNKDFEKLMKRYNINHYSTFSKLKAQSVERLNRTLKNQMWKEFNVRGSYNYTRILDTLLKKYNSTEHRTIGLPPNKVDHSNRYDVLKKNV